MRGFVGGLTLLVLGGCAEVPEPIRPELTVFIDETGELSLQEVIDRAAFEPIEGERPSFGFMSGALWCRARFEAPDGRWFVDVDNAQLDELDVYVRRSDGSFQATRTGDRRPFASRPISYPTFVTPAPESPARPPEVYLRVQNAGSIVVPVRVWRDADFTRYASAAQLGYGFYFAFLLALALYNLFLLVASRDSAYLFYVLYLVSFVLFQAALEGHAYMWLWPGATWFATYAAVAILLLSMSASLMFARGILDLANDPAGKLLRGAAIGYLLIVPLVFLHYPIGHRLGIGAALLLILALPVIIVRSICNGSRPARYLALAFAAIAPGGLALAARQLGILPASFLADHLVKIGTMLEALLLSFALADRVDRLTEEAASAKDALLVSQRDVSRRLLAAQDDERRRVAGELHDGLGQRLLALVNDLRRLGLKAPDVADAAERAAEAVGDVRSVAHRLHPARLDRLGLSEAVRATAEELLGGAELEHEVVIEDVDDRVAHAHWIHVYRIVQESLSNVVRHAQAREVSMVLRGDGDVVLLRIEDDGRGRGSEDQEGLGLLGIRERARFVDAELRFHEGLGDAGFGLTMEIPSVASTARG